MSQTQILERNLTERLGELVIDQTITEISLNTDGKIWIERAGDAYMTPSGVHIEPSVANALAQDLAGDNPFSGQKPLASADFEMFSSLWRSQVVGSPVVEHGAAFSLRRNVIQNFTLEELTENLDSNILDRVFNADLDPRDAKAFEAFERKDIKGFIRAAIDARWNIVFSGGPGAGKTTWMRAALSAVPETERLLMIEDVRDIHTTLPNTLSLKTTRDVYSAELLKACLRLRPDRILMGEIRGAEAFDFLRAINSGYSGGITTLHANSPDGALNAIALMVMQADLGLTQPQILEYCHSMIDVVIQLNRIDGNRFPTGIKILRKR